MSREVLKIGLLGCGVVAQIAHLPALSRTRRAQLVAICDRSEELLNTVGNKAGIKRRYARYEDLLADPLVDAVVLAVPDPLHVPFSWQALSAGKHVLVEKPLGVASGECRELVEFVRQTKFKLQVGSMKRHDPGVRFAREFIQDRVGSILSVTCIYRDTLFRQAMQESCLDPIVSPAINAEAAPDHKANRERYNLWTQGAHLFDTLRFLAGNVSAVTAQVVRHADQSAWHGLVELGGGGGGHFELICKSCGDWWEQYTIYGENGSVDVSVGLPFYHRPARVRAFDGRTQQWSRPLAARSNAYVNQLEAFADAVLQDHPTNPNAADGLAVVQLLESVEQSIQKGGRVPVPVEGVS